MVWDVAFALFHKDVAPTSVATQADGRGVAVLNCCLVEPLGGSSVLVHRVPQTEDPSSQVLVQRHVCCAVLTLGVRAEGFPQKPPEHAKHLFRRVGLVWPVEGRTVPPGSIQSVLWDTYMFHPRLLSRLL